MQRLSKFLRLSSSDRRLLVEAAIWLVVARLAILIVPFRWVALFLGTHMAKSTNTANSNNRDFLERVSWALQTASRYMPWDCKCLAQAIAGKAMFKRRSVQSTLYLGVAKDGEEKLKAHAWLRSGNVVVTGEQGVNQFVVISIFPEEKH